MADFSDVEQSLADAISGIIYPQGSSHSSIVGVTCRIYRGWPNTATLNSDLSAGVVNVTITPDNEFGKTTTRYLPEWRFSDVDPSLTVGVIHQTVSIGGAVTAGNVIGMLVDGKPYSYRVAHGDTLSLVAANLCASINASRLAIVSGSSISIPGAQTIKVRVVCDNAAYFECRRQEKDVRVIFWCSSPPIRDLLAAATDLALAQSAFLTLPDSTSAHIIYRNSASSDQSQNALLYRRDLVYCIEYPTVLNVDLPSMLFGAAAINDQISFG